MSAYHSCQRGAALIVSMVLLVAITLIGVFVMSGSHLEWLMASNSRFQTDAEMRAEAALADGEKDIKTNIPNPLTFGWPTPDAYYATADIPSDPRDISNWVAGSFTTNNASTVPPAVYFIEYLGCTVTAGTTGCQTVGTTSIQTYRIWAYASDSKGAARIAQLTLADTVSVSPGPTITHTYTSNFALIDHDQPPNP